MHIVGNFLGYCPGAMDQQPIAAEECGGELGFGKQAAIGFAGRQDDLDALLEMAAGLREILGSRISEAHGGSATE